MNGILLKSILTKSQLEVARLVAHGYTNQAIASETSTSLNNVKHLMTQCYEALGITEGRYNARVRLAGWYWRDNPTEEMIDKRASELEELHEIAAAAWRAIYSLGTRHGRQARHMCDGENL